MFRELNKIDELNLHELSTQKLFWLLIWDSPRVAWEIWWDNCKRNAGLIKKAHRLNRLEYLGVLLRGFLWPGINERFWKEENARLKKEFKERYGLEWNEL